MRINKTNEQKRASKQIKTSELTLKQTSKRIKKSEKLMTEQINERMKRFK